jgi:hypothetical protein
MDTHRTGFKLPIQSLLDLCPEGTPKGDELRKMLEEKHMEFKTYNARKKHEEYITELSQTLPAKAIQFMMRLQMAVDSAMVCNPDDEDLNVINKLIFDVDEEDNLMNIITGLIGVVNHSKVEPAKKCYSTRKRLSRAETLACAQDPENSLYSFCPKCSRPMLTENIETHQKNTNICVEIKAGRKATLRHQDARHFKIGEYIVDQVFHDDSDDE